MASNVLFFSFQFNGIDEKKRFSGSVLSCLIKNRVMGGLGKGQVWVYRCAHLENP